MIANSSSKNPINELESYLNNAKSSDLHASKIARLLKQVDEQHFHYYLAKIPTELIGAIALELPDRYFSKVVQSLTTKKLSEAITKLESDDQTDFIQELEETNNTIAKAVFKQLDAGDQAEISQLKQYHEDQAGAYMQVEAFTANINEKVHNVIRDFARRKKNNELENVHKLFVVDDNGVLRYTVGMDDLLIFNVKQTLKENIATYPNPLTQKEALDTENIQVIARYFEEYDLIVVPIVNEQGQMVGRVTSDDIYPVIHERATEQMYHLAGLDDDVEEDDDILSSAVARASWLSVNLVTAIIASLVIAIFQDTLESIVALAILMPIVASMGGNAGTQSLTVVVRQLALGDIATKDAVRTIKKEVLIAMGNGLLFALLMGAIAAIWFDQNKLGIVIALSMLINIITAGFFGATIPLLLKRFNIDPAIGSTVILTTVTDVVGFLSFLGLATMLLL
jgi:magnesium transporter